MADVAEYSNFLCVVLIVIAKALQLQVTLVKFLQRHRYVIIFFSVFFFFFPLWYTRNYILTLGVVSYLNNVFWCPCPLAFCLLQFFLIEGCGGIRYCIYFLKGRILKKNCLQNLNFCRYLFIYFYFISVCSVLHSFRLAVQQK